MKIRDVVFLDYFAGRCVGEEWGDMTENPTSSSAWGIWHGILHWARVNLIYAVLRKIRQLDKYWEKIKINTCVKF